MPTQGTAVCVRVAASLCPYRRGRRPARRRRRQPPACLFKGVPEQSVRTGTPSASPALLVTPPTKYVSVKYCGRARYRMECLAQLPGASSAPVRCTADPPLCAPTRASLPGYSDPWVLFTRSSRQFAVNPRCDTGWARVVRPLCLPPPALKCRGGRDGWRGVRRPASRC